MSTHDPGEWLDVGQLCARWHRTRFTIWRYAKHGIPNSQTRLAPMKLGGGKNLFRLATIEHIEREWEMANSPVTPRRRRRRRTTPEGEAA